MKKIIILKINYVSLIISLSMLNNIPISPTIENNLSLIKDLPTIENILMVENLPFIENVPIIDGFPTIKGMSPKRRGQLQQ
jgi:hypothetical protein